jgi:hypothetical protein
MFQKNSILAIAIHPYPTTCEAIRQTGDLYNKTKVSTPLFGLAYLLQ